ncbi:MAG: methionine sulfoxide reductase heme-binding subunit [Gaiellaceae bacterium]|jgi:sulfoxide reductase heme-binding subunit YedZ|nr:methionine sulfoxide reductase heme-binding subunit [Gaiellaceae bacterium]
MTGQLALHYGWWIASRASGMVALLLVTISVCVGLLVSTKLVKRRGAAPLLVALHEQTALAGLVSIAVHGATLLADPWLHPGLAGVLVPFASPYRPLFTGLGVVAAYLAAVLGLSYYVRQQVGAALWRKAHRATILVWALGLVHTFGAGTDAGAVWFRELVFLTSAPVALLFGVRVANGLRGSRRATGTPALT